MKATIYDVAKHAGVSIATVSKVINQTGRISTETRAKVERVMEQLDYAPSLVASALTGKQTFTLGLLLPDLANPYFAEIARTVEDHAHELGFSVMICSTDNTLERELRNIALFRQKRVDGIIIATGAKHEEAIKELQKSLPVALISRDIPSIKIDTVLVDDYIGGMMATNHLIEYGHHRIAIIAEDTIIMSSKERIRGYKAAIEAASVPYDAALVKVCSFNVDSVKKLTNELLDEHPDISAIFACNDLIASVVSKVIRERGKLIPSDISLIGFDNTILAEYADPPLTTIAQPIREMGKRVVNLLIQQVQDRKSLQERVVMQPELICRASVAAFKRVVSDQA